MDPQAVRRAVDQVIEPALGRPLGDLGIVRDVEVGADGAVAVLVGTTIPDAEAELRRRIQTALAELAGGGAVTVDFAPMSDDERAAVGGLVRPERGIAVGATGSPTRVITIASGKGGVGKSSVTANVAVALAADGHTVGVIDADVWGYSIPKMLGIDRKPQVFDQMLIPPRRHGVAAMSMDYFVEPDQAVVWRGPMLHKALEQFLADVHWDDPDFLLLDMPPGTGDVAISISQFLPRSQAVIVTTPQVTAQRVAKRAARMAEKVNQEVLGVVENMSWFTGDDGKRYPIFGEGGGAALADELGVPLLGRVPLLPAMREGADAGVPVAAAAPGSEAAEAFAAVAREIAARRPRVRTHPELVIR